MDRTQSIKEVGDAEAYAFLLAPEVRDTCSVIHIQRMLRLEGSLLRAFAPGVLTAPGQELDILSLDANRAVVLPPQVAPALAQLQNTAVEVVRTPEGWRIDFDSRLLDSCRDGIVSSDQALDAFLAVYPLLASATITRANYSDDFDRTPTGFITTYATTFSPEFLEACAYDPFLQLIIGPGFDEILGLNEESDEENWKAREEPNEIVFEKRNTGDHVVTAEWNGQTWKITRFLGRVSC